MKKFVAVLCSLFLLVSNASMMAVPSEKSSVSNTAVVASETASTDAMGDALGKYAVTLIMIAFICDSISGHQTAAMTCELLLVIWTLSFLYLFLRLCFSRKVITTVEGRKRGYMMTWPTITIRSRVWTGLVLIVSYTGVVIITLFIVAMIIFR